MTNTPVVVIGGGAAGMMAALAARQTGAQVTLVEPNEKLGRKVHHRQGPVQPDQQHHTPGGAGPRASERTVPVQRGDPVPPGGGDGIL